MSRGTTQSTAKDFVERSSMDRSGPSNKNLQSSARRKSAATMVAAATKLMSGRINGPGLQV